MRRQRHEPPERNSIPAAWALSVEPIGRAFVDGGRWVWCVSRPSFVSALSRCAPHRPEGEPARSFRANLTFGDSNNGNPWMSLAIVDLSASMACIGACEKFSIAYEICEALAYSATRIGYRFRADRMRRGHPRGRVPRSQHARRASRCAPRHHSVEKNPTGEARKDFLRRRTPSARRVSSCAWYRTSDGRGF